MINFEDRVGPKLAKDARGVDPHSMSRLAELLDSLLNSGCPAVVMGGRFEQAMVQLIGENPLLFGAKGAARDLIPNQFTDHVMAHFPMLPASSVAPCSDVVMASLQEAFDGLTLKIKNC